MAKDIIEGLDKFIVKLYGSRKAAADALGVSDRTINNWVNQNPRGLLKHGPEIIATKNITWTQLAGEVLYQEENL